MIPTFDFINVVRAAVKPLISAAVSPIAITLYIAAGVATLFTSLAGYFSFGIFQSVSFDLSALFDYADSGFLSAFCYAFAVDYAARTGYYVLVFVSGLIAFLPTFFLAIFGLSKIRYFRNAMRETWRHMIT